MNSNLTKKSLTLGEFITQVYDVCGKQKAKGIVRFAMETRLIEFRIQQPQKSVV
jgi:hypothetical protein